MKNIQTLLRSVAAILFAVLITGCANEFQGKKEIATAAGFKVITPVKPEHVALLPTLAEQQITEITYEGQTYYILPDAANNRAYVGGPTEYQAYQRLRLEKQISQEQLAAARSNQATTLNQMNWGAWGGWNTVGRYGRVGVYR